jgi:hypothetical protein
VRVLLAMLGASEFPRRLDLSSPAFAKSHTALRDWLLDNAHGPMVAGEDCLDLFDSPRSWPDQEAWAPLQPFTRDAIAKMVVIGTVLRGQRRSCLGPRRQRTPRC